jgi:chromosome segregation ATPase
MPRQTDGERIYELTKAVAALDEGLKNARTQLDAVYEAVTKHAESLSELRRDYEKEIALLKRDIDDHKKWKDDQKKQHDEVGRRLWAFGPNLLAAIIGLIGIVISLAGSFAIAYFVKR